VDIQNGNVLKISPASHVQANRGFFFQIDDPTAMSEWMGSLHRDRYSTVRDERDAYQQLQDQFSGQMDMTAKMLEESAAEKEKLSYEVAAGQREMAEAKLALHQVLTRTTVIAVSDYLTDFFTECISYIVQLVKILVVTTVLSALIGASVSVKLLSTFSFLLLFTCAQQLIHTCSVRGRLV
jgi:K+-sensing histidine kinase KdpD